MESDPMLSTFAMQDATETPMNFQLYSSKSNNSRSRLGFKFDNPAEIGVIRDDLSPNKSPLTGLYNKSDSNRVNPADSIPVNRILKPTSTPSKRKVVEFDESAMRSESVLVPGAKFDEESSPLKAVFPSMSSLGADNDDDKSYYYSYEDSTYSNVKTPRSLESINPRDVRSNEFAPSEHINSPVSQKVPFIEHKLPFESPRDQSVRMTSEEAKSSMDSPTYVYLRLGQRVGSLAAQYREYFSETTNPLSKSILTEPDLPSPIHSNTETQLSVSKEILPPLLPSPLSSSARQSDSPTKFVERGILSPENIELNKNGYTKIPIESSSKINVKYTKPRGHVNLPEHLTHALKGNNSIYTDAEKLNERLNILTQSPEKSTREPYEHDKATYLSYCRRSIDNCFQTIDAAEIPNRYLYSEIYRQLLLNAAILQRLYLPITPCSRDLFAMPYTPKIIACPSTLSTAQIQAYLRFSKNAEGATVNQLTNEWKRVDDGKQKLYINKSESVLQRGLPFPLRASKQESSLSQTSWAACLKNFTPEEQSIFTSQQCSLLIDNQTGFLIHCPKANVYLSSSIELSRLRERIVPSSINVLPVRLSPRTVYRPSESIWQSILTDRLTTKKNEDPIVPTSRPRPRSAGSVRPRKKNISNDSSLTELSAIGQSTINDSRQTARDILQATLINNEKNDDIEDEIMFRDLAATLATITIDSTSNQTANTQILIDKGHVSDHRPRSRPSSASSTRRLSSSNPRRHSLKSDLIRPKKLQPRKNSEKAIDMSSLLFETQMSFQEQHDWNTKLRNLADSAQSEYPGRIIDLSFALLSYRQGENAYLTYQHALRTSVTYPGAWPLSPYDQLISRLLEVMMRIRYNSKRDKQASVTSSLGQLIGQAINLATYQSNSQSADSTSTFLAWVGRTLCLLQYHQQAEQVLLAALLLSPLCGRALYELAELYIYRCDFATAVKLLGRIQNQSSLYASARLEIAWMQYLQAPNALSYQLSNRITYHGVDEIIYQGCLAAARSMTNSDVGAEFSLTSLAASYSHSFLGFSCHTGGSHAQAKVHYKTAIAANETVCLPYLLAACLPISHSLDTSVVSTDSDQYSMNSETADAYFRRGILFQPSNSSDRWISCLAYAQFLIAKLSDISTGEYYLRQSVKLSARKCSWPAIALAQHLQYTRALPAEAVIVLTTCLNSLPQTNNPQTLDFVTKQLQIERIAIHIALGYSYIDTNEFEKAQQHCFIASQLCIGTGAVLPGHCPLTHRLRGAICWHLGNSYRGEALTHFRNAATSLRTNIPSSLSTYHLTYGIRHAVLRQAAVALAIQGRYNMAYAAIQAAAPVTSIPTNLPALTWQASGLMAYLYGGSLSLATSYLSRGSESGDAQSLIWLGQINLETSNYSEAVQSFSKAASVAPNLPTPWAFLSIALYHNGSKNRAIDAAGKALDLLSKSVHIDDAYSVSITDSIICDVACSLAMFLLESQNDVHIEKIKTLLLEIIHKSSETSLEHTEGAARLNCIESSCSYAALAGWLMGRLTAREGALNEVLGVQTEADDYFSLSIRLCCESNSKVDDITYLTIIRQAREDVDRQNLQVSQLKEVLKQTDKNSSKKGSRMKAARIGAAALLSEAKQRYLGEVAEKLEDESRILASKQRLLDSLESRLKHGVQKHLPISELAVMPVYVYVRQAEWLDGLMTAFCTCDDWASLASLDSS